MFLRNNNCTAALSTARCYLEATDDFPIFLSSQRPFLKISTEMKRANIIQSLMTRKIVIFQETSSINVDYFRYLMFPVNFLNFRLCEIQLGAQCLLGEQGPLKPVGGKFILCCNFDVKRLPIKVPPFYEDCLKSFAKCSVTNNQCEEITDDINEILQIILWNNKHIRVDGKPAFYKALAEKGILIIGDLISENNELITKCSLRELNLTPLDQFRLISVLNALPSQWRDS